MSLAFKYFANFLLSLTFVGSIIYFYFFIFLSSNSQQQKLKIKRKFFSIRAHQLTSSYSSVLLILIINIGKYIFFSSQFFTEQIENCTNFPRYQFFSRLMCKLVIFCKTNLNEKCSKINYAGRGISLYNFSLIYVI